MSCSVYDKAPLPFFPVPSLHSVKNLHKLPVRLCALMLMQNFSYILTETSMLVGKLRCSILNLVFWEITFNSKKCYKTFKKKLSTLQPLLSVVIQIIRMAAVTVGCHTFFFIFFLQIYIINKNKPCLKKTLFVWQPTVTAAMWVISMTTDSDGCHVDYLLKQKSYIISHYWKWFPRKLNLIKSTSVIVFKVRCRIWVAFA